MAPTDGGKMKEQYDAPQVTDLGEVATLTQGASDNNGFDANSSMGMMVGMGS
jgi:hypothetical protein